MTQHSGLPVAGYTEQSDKNVALVNENKILEERCLRQIDRLLGANVDANGNLYDLRMISLARTKLQEAFMWLNRAVFQPRRIALPEDRESGE